MNIYIYADESGVFDVKHNKYFVFAGLIILNKENRDIAIRKYSKAENDIRNSLKSFQNEELKASKISNKYKSKLFRSLNQLHKFSIIIKQEYILKEIFAHKKDKQRYLDYAFKIGVKRALKDLIYRELINNDEEINLYFFIDEHTTATNGKYELKESLEQEFKRGTYNFEYDKFFPPIFKNIKYIDLQYRDSSKVHLIRASDIIANKIYFLINSGNTKNIEEIKNLHITYLPK